MELHILRHNINSIKGDDKKTLLEIIIFIDKDGDNVKVVIVDDCGNTIFEFIGLYKTNVEKAWMFHHSLAFKEEILDGELRNLLLIFEEDK